MKPQKRGNSLFGIMARPLYRKDKRAGLPWKARMIPVIYVIAFLAVYAAGWLVTHALFITGIAALFATAAIIRRIS